MGLEAEFNKFVSTGQTGLATPAPTGQVGGATWNGSYWEVAKTPQGGGSTTTYGNLQEQINTIAAQEAGTTTQGAQNTLNNQAKNTYGASTPTGSGIPNQYKGVPSENPYQALQNQSTAANQAALTRQSPNANQSPPFKPAPTPAPAPTSQSLAGTSPPLTQSVGSQIGSSLVGLAAGYTGNVLGNVASKAAWGSSNGTFGNLGGTIGGAVGGIAGAALAGTPSLGIGAVAGAGIGAAFGAFVGNFVGNGLDALGGLFFGGNKATPVAERGKGYINPANQPPANFTGGQMQGIDYRVRISKQVRPEYGGGTEYQQFIVKGAVGGVSLVEVDGQQMWVLSHGTGSTPFTYYYGVSSASIDSVERVDGQADTGGNRGDAPNANTPFIPNNPPVLNQGSGFDGSPFDALEAGEKYQEGTGKREPKSVPDTTKPSPDKPRQVNPSGTPTAPAPAPSPLLGSSPSYGSNTGANSSNPSASKSGSVAKSPFSGEKSAYESPAFEQKAFESKPYVAGLSNPADYGKAIDSITGKEKVTNPTIDPAKATPQPTVTPKPNTPNNPSTDSYDTAKILGAVAVVAGTVAALKVGSDLLVNNSLPKIDQIAQNTTNANQQANAATGACTALNSATCTTGLKDSIVNPVNANANANQALNNANNAVNDAAIKGIAANQLTQNGTLANILAFVSRIYNNQFVHSSLSFMTTMTTIHNAAMLSRDVGETLGTVVDNSVNLSGQKLKDKDGNDIDFTSWVGTNVRALVIQLIGADKYVQLALQWQKANTIYHSAMAVVNTTQSMLDPISSAVEYGMENVSKIGNGLREDGVVSENSYPAMDETIRARRVNRFERLNDTLEGAENIASNLSSVTSSAVSVKEDYKQLREDSKELKDKAAAFNTTDSEARATLKASLPTEVTPITLAPAPAEDEEP